MEKMIESICICLIHIEGPVSSLFRLVSAILFLSSVIILALIKHGVLYFHLADLSIDANISNMLTDYNFFQIAKRVVKFEQNSPQFFVQQRNRPM